ncbi:hypothetical protein HHK36_027981 [Tetracentron sinense]|uniref:Remorin C-terminal domain-containing protein n=1 Tax=Tetracentron sinense TaxID=13715 RepID=A0A834YFS5_TETSI|nr:hypothetical protein HHK36_027981 [Tetracentron sinense]
MDEREVAESLIEVSSNSKEPLGKKLDIPVQDGTWSPNSFISLSPSFSPSPICSPASLGLFSERFLSQLSSEFSTPLKQSSHIISNEEKKSHSTEGEEEIHIVNQSGLYSEGGEVVKQHFCPNNKPKQKAKSVRTYRKLLLCEPTTISLSTSSGPIDSSSYQAPHTISNSQTFNSSTYRGIHAGDKQEERGQFQSILALHESHLSPESTLSTYGDSDVGEVVNQHSRAGSGQGERPFHDFISGIKKTNFEAKVDDWKDTKSTKFMNNLRKKEAVINAWEFKETTRASMNLKEIQSKLENERLKGLKKMHKKTSIAQKKADAKKARVRQSTAKKISKVSKVAEKTMAVGKVPWWKTLLHW